DRAAPEHGAVPARRPFVRVQQVAHERMDAVGADEDVAVRGGAMCAATIEEIGAHARFVLTKRPQTMPAEDTRFTEPRAHRLIDQGLQPATMDGELRHLVAGVEAAQLAPDLLPEAIGVEQFVGADADRIEPLEQPELGELLDRVRKRVDADAELADALRLLID